VTVEIRVLGREDSSVLGNVAAGVFDHPVATAWCTEFFEDPRHHLVVALEEEVVVGFASAVHYVHPDKPPELWINEVGVAPSHQRQGIGRRLLAALLDLGGRLGCVQAWVLTSPGNTAARQLYAAAGGQEAAELSVMYEFPLGEGRR
jgi:GNAT superfamily N-acetyltransferase